jgi:hypothetical protein
VFLLGATELALGLGITILLTVLLLKTGLNLMLKLTFPTTTNSSYVNTSIFYYDEFQTC